MAGNVGAGGTGAGGTKGGGGSSGTGGAIDGGTDGGGGAAALGPRLLAPLSTSTVTSRRPTLHWALPTGADGAHVRLCRDRACTIDVTSFDATGSSGAPSADLPTGVVFWNVSWRAGGVTGQVATPTWEFIVRSTSAPVDTSWGTMLDVNGDGYADIAMVGSGVGDGGTVPVVNVYPGGPTGPSTTPSTILTDPVTDIFHDFGHAIASAGDVNGDGYADLIVRSEPYAYVYLGGPAGLVGTPATALGEGNDDFGVAVSSIGDFNGDGYADVIVSDDLYSTSLLAAAVGITYVYLGSAAGLSATPSREIIGPWGSRGYFGGALAGVGDLNGDGYGDFVVGSWAADRANVYYGSGPNLGAVGATLLLDPADKQGGLAQDSFGSTIAGGDLNGDGYSDVIVEGYVFPGGPTGLSATDTLTFACGCGPNSGGPCGASVGVGDFNGDGRDDLVCSFPSGIPIPTSTGSSHVYLTGPTGAASASQTLATGANFRAGAGAGDVDGDGFADVLLGFSASATLYFGSTSGFVVPIRTVVLTR
jgi:hypothetical protein